VLKTQKLLGLDKSSSGFRITDSLMAMELAITQWLVSSIPFEWIPVLE
jgi:hypothetical protein